MVSFPPCKINLGLQITSKRADGYHELNTCFYPVPWTDILEIIPSQFFSFTVSGISISGNRDDNLCVKAYQLMKREFDIPPVRIHLHKIIPMGAGLGGGSSDAAWTLRLLNDVFDLKLERSTLLTLGAELGSDCAFFIGDTPKLGTGRGELLSDLSVSLRNKFLVIVKPAIHVSTGDAYSRVTPRPADHDLKSILETYPVSAWNDVLKNDFEDSVFTRFPALAEIKKVLYQEGAEYASMSGSGSAVFGIFKNPRELTRKFAHAIVWSSIL